MLIALPVVLVAAAVIGSVIYFGIKHPSVLYIAVSVVDVLLVIQAAHRLVLNLAKNQLQSAEQVVDRYSHILQLIVAVVLALAAIGQVRGWMHGTYGNVIRGLIVLYLIGAPIYWLGGKRRLIAALSPRPPQ